MLKITNLSASIGDKQILDNVNIELPFGECLLITGQNGAGKSTLLHAIMGRPDITITGEINLNSTDLHELECHERSQAGVFMAHQSPPTIDGVNTMTLFKEIHKVQNIGGTTGELIKTTKTLFNWIGLPDGWEKRPFNNGASGGERKKNELAQVTLLKNKTKLLLLDEPDSGLEQSSRQKIIDLIQETKNQNGCVLLVTHDKELQELYKDNQLDLSHGR
jgi:Fe-S cluster assembly ATP-binding protein